MEEYEEAVTRTETMGDEIKRHCNLIKDLEYSLAQLEGKYAMAQTQIKSLTDENNKFHTPEGVVSKMHLELAEALVKKCVSSRKDKYLEGEDKSPQLDTIVEKLE
mmetsp:Transcript_63037/g.74561  ORF Transcript_63037/g.74561 Transcript_63037/m.74561 type:complete len:105 (-) Transcript_63037:637-951(-)